MLQHLELYRATCTAASVSTALAAVGGGSLTVKSLPNPRLAALQAFGADCQYGTLHSPESFPGRPDPAVTVVGDVKAAYLLEHLHDFPSPTPLKQTAVLDAQGIQDNVANQIVDMTAEFLYDVGRSVAAKNLPPGRLTMYRVTSQGNIADGVWTSYGAAGYQFVGNSEKDYAILAVMAFSANTIAVRFQHPSFAGLTPGKRGTSDVALGEAWFDICPVFKGATPLSLDGITSNAETQTAVVYLWEID